MKRERCSVPQQIAPFEVRGGGEISEIAKKTAIRRNRVDAHTTQHQQTREKIIQHQKRWVTRHNRQQ